jgi:hypothetical protein
MDFPQHFPLPCSKTSLVIGCETPGFRTISLLNTGYKIYAKIIKNKYDNIIGEEQNGFKKGRSCCGGYFTMKILIEKHGEFNMETHIAFVDFKKASDRVSRKELLRILASDQVPRQTIQNICNLYKTNLISVKTEDK